MMARHQASPAPMGRRSTTVRASSAPGVAGVLWLDRAARMSAHQFRPVCDTSLGKPQIYCSDARRAAAADARGAMNLTGLARGVRGRDKVPADGRVEVSTLELM